MKFGRYLKDTQAPEWKRAYIDYPGLKKVITAIRNFEHYHQSAAFASELSVRSHQISSSQPSIQPEVSEHIGEKAGPISQNPHSRSSAPLNPNADSQRDSSIQKWDKEKPSIQLQTIDRPPVPKRRSTVAQVITNSIRRSRGKSVLYHGKRPLSVSHPPTPLPLRDLIMQLSPIEVSFFKMLDAQLDKIESFYVAREKEMLDRSKMLQEQFNDLNIHKKLVEGDRPDPSWTSALFETVKSRFATNRKVEETKASQDEESSESKSKSQTIKEREKGLPKSPSMRSLGQHTISTRGIPLSSDIEGYLQAKKRLKKAVQEHYRGVEVLHDYRILNITGFRKSLKKFEKVTKIPVQTQYMSEKVDKSAFASDRAVSDMMTEIENLYAKAFLRGDLKKTKKRLRGGNYTKSHHFSTFRSGSFLGLALPAFISGLVSCLRKSTHQAIPGWDGLLFVYGMLFIPTLFSLLVGVNLLIWSRSRINYPFIFELNVRSKLDYRQYFETPSILLAGLCYAFWLSFSRIGAPTVSPTVWPLVWLGFVAVVMINPFPLLFRSSRFWFLKSTGKLLLPGLKRVEFTDFWLGDQFCSLVFPISNMYLFGCVYANGFGSDWRKCGATSRFWPVAFVLASLPFIVRLVQSIKRYADSGLITHMINGGKYLSGIINYFFFYIWRHHGKHEGALFALWCFFNTYYAIYAASWDLLMDWSVLRRHSRYRFLRSELIYTNHVGLYYVAIILNVIIRFAFVIYIPAKGPDMQLRAFIGAFLEIFRRWQWNFYRLENEHLGNMDQYRITREVPLPYVIEDSAEDDGDDPDDIDLKTPR